MRKRIQALLSLLLAAALLCGCAPVGTGVLNGALRHEREDYAVKLLCRFEQMPYERPDLDAMRTKADELEQAFADGARYRRVTRLLDELYAMYYNADTMYTIADIRNCQDLTDDFYAEEYAWCSTALTEISQIMERVYLACGASPLADRLERSYFWEGFAGEYGPETESVLTDEYVALAAKESALLAQFRALTVAPTIELDGRETDLNEYVLTASDAELYRAYDAYYDQYNPVLGELYLQLVALRKEQARLLGFSSYAEMAYAMGFGRDFGIEEGERFIESVKRHLVPLYKRLSLLGAWSGVYVDEMTEEELFAVLEAAAEGLGGEAEEAFRFMEKYGLYDLRVSAEKPAMSFQTYLNDYEAPFLFVSPTGDTEDILTVTHEFGHYLDSYVSFNAYRTMDLAECFSQAMQFLSLDALEGTLRRRQLRNLRSMNLLDILDTYVQQCSFAEFEKRAFEAAEPSVEQLNEISLELAKEYGYYDGLSRNYYAKSWIDTTHFFEQPYYVISYPVSAGVALEIYESELVSGDGMDRFLKLLDAESPGVVGAVGEAGLQNPLTEERVAQIAAFLERQLA